MYNPTPEQAAADRQKAYETGVPHGAFARRSRARRAPSAAAERGCARCIPRGAGYVPPGDKYAGQEKIKLLVRSEMVRRGPGARTATRASAARARRHARCGAPRARARRPARARARAARKPRRARGTWRVSALRDASRATPPRQHLDEEYGGPFYVEVSPKMKIEDLRIVIRVRRPRCPRVSADPARAAG
jgi:hypothetical protein